MAGETTGSPGTEAPFMLPTGQFIVPFTASFGSAENETNDVKQIGYLPPDVTVYGVHYRPTDMDTNVSPAVVHKVTVGTTDIVTGLTGAQTGTGQTVPCIPLRITAKTLVTVTSTTAAATGASGTLYLGLICQR